MPHELGHQFGLAGDKPNPDFGIMSDEGVGTSLRFFYGHINIMRWRIKSPGE
jgi:hypothetical protein